MTHRKCSFSYRLSDCSDSGGSAGSLLPRCGTDCSGSFAVSDSAAAVSADFGAAAGSAAVPGFDSYS